MAWFYWLKTHWHFHVRPNLCVSLDICVVLRYIFMYTWMNVCTCKPHNAVVFTPTYVQQKLMRPHSYMNSPFECFCPKQQRISIHFYMDTIWLRKTSTYEHMSGIWRNSLMVLCTHVPYMTHDLVVNERAYITIARIQVDTYFHEHIFFCLLGYYFQFSVHNIYNRQQKHQVVSRMWVCWMSIHSHTYKYFASTEDSYSDINIYVACCCHLTNLYVHMYVHGDV